MLPFLAILTDSARFFEHPSAQPIVHALGLTEPKQLVLPITIGFGLSALIAGIMRLLLLWANIRLSFAAGADLGLSIYRRTLYQPYSVHIARNSSEVINGIYVKSGTAINFINMTLNIMGSFIMLIAILFALLTVDALTAIAAFAGFGLIYVLIIGLVRHRLLINSQIHARESTLVFKTLQEGLGGIRDVLIDGSQSIYCQLYSKADQSLRRAEGHSSFISSSPRSGVEVLGMLFIAGLAYSLAQQPAGISNVLPVLGALALGAQRLLPTLQQAYGAWSNMQGSYGALIDTLDLLDQPLPDYAGQSAVQPLPFQKMICLKQINFRYSTQTPWVLNKLNLTITKGSRVGFIGTTGCGKSTLLDIIMGLLHANTGSIEIDGKLITKGNLRAWQTHIAHVPQTIFLADSTIEENIAFGVPIHQIDQVRVKRAASQAQIAEIIESWPEKYRTAVGERGVRLSGGQLQRIGIARALYKQADVIIFDEGTSALDIETERSVMQAIEGLAEDITLLIISHRLATLKNCTQIFELGEGGIKQSGSYRDIIEKITNVEPTDELNKSKL